MKWLTPQVEAGLIFFVAFPACALVLPWCALRVSRWLRARNPAPERRNQSKALKAEKQPETTQVRVKRAHPSADGCLAGAGGCLLLVLGLGVAGVLAYLGYTELSGWIHTVPSWAAVMIFLLILLLLK